MQILGNLTKNLIASDEHDEQINTSLPLVLTAVDKLQPPPPKGHFGYLTAKASLDA